MEAPLSANPRAQQLADLVVTPELIEKLGKKLLGLSQEQVRL